MGLFSEAVNMSNKGSGSPPLIPVVLVAAALLSVALTGFTCI